MDCATVNDNRTIDEKIITLICSISEMITDDSLAKGQNDLKIVRAHIINKMRDIVKLINASSGLDNNVSVEYIYACKEIENYSATLASGLSFVMMKTEILIKEKTTFRMEWNSPQSSHSDRLLNNSSWKVSNTVVPEVVTRESTLTNTVTFHKPIFRDFEGALRSRSTDSNNLSLDYGFFDDDSCVAASLKSENHLL